MTARAPLVPLGASAVIHAVLLGALSLAAAPAPPPVAPLFVDLTEESIVTAGAAAGRESAAPSHDPPGSRAEGARSRPVRPAAGATTERSALASPTLRAPLPAAPRRPAPRPSPPSSASPSVEPASPPIVPPAWASPWVEPSAPPAMPSVKTAPANEEAPTGPDEERVRGASGGDPGGAGASGDRRTSAPGGPAAGVGAGEVHGDAVGASGGGALMARATPGAGYGEPGAEYGPYLAAIRWRVQEALRYPLTARRRGLAGTVHLEILIGQDGAVGGAAVAVSSSHAVLDAAALEAVRMLPAQPFPAGLPPRPLRVRLPVTFRLE